MTSLLRRFFLLATLFYRSLHFAGTQAEITIHITGIISK